MRNAEIADALNELATLYELDGAIRYRVLAYREAARVIRQSPVSVEELARTGRVTDLRAHGAGDAVEVAGSARRRTETCHDIDLIATAGDPAALAQALLDHPLAATRGSVGESGARITTHNGVAVDLRIVAPDAYG